MQKPQDQPQDNDDRDGKDEGENRGKSQEESPVAPGVTPRLAQVTREQAIVAAVHFPCDVKDVAQNGDGPHEHADAEIGGHAHQR